MYTEVLREWLVFTIMVVALSGSGTPLPHGELLGSGRILALRASACFLLGFAGRVIGCDDSFPWPPASHYLHRRQLITSYLLQSHSPTFPRTRTLGLNIDITLSTHYPGFDAAKRKFKYTT